MHAFMPDGRTDATSPPCTFISNDMAAAPDLCTYMTKATTATKKHTPDEFHLTVRDAWDPDPQHRVRAQGAVARLLGMARANTLPPMHVDAALTALEAICRVRDNVDDAIVFSRACVVTTVPRAFMANKVTSCVGFLRSVHMPRMPALAGALARNVDLGRLVLDGTGLLQKATLDTGGESILNSNISVMAAHRLVGIAQVHPDHLGRLGAPSKADMCTILGDLGKRRGDGKNRIKIINLLFHQHPAAQPSLDDLFAVADGILTGNPYSTNNEGVANFWRTIMRSMWTGSGPAATWTHAQRVELVQRMMHDRIENVSFVGALDKFGYDRRAHAAAFYVAFWRACCNSRWSLHVCGVENAVREYVMDPDTHNIVAQQLGPTAWRHPEVLEYANNRDVLSFGIITEVVHCEVVPADVDRALARCPWIPYHEIMARYETTQTRWRMELVLCPTMLRAMISAFEHRTYAMRRFPQALRVLALLAVEYRALRRALRPPLRGILLTQALRRLRAAFLPCVALIPAGRSTSFEDVVEPLLDTTRLP